MRLLVVRHAIAVDREVFARAHADDATRPLTAEGRAKMERAAEGLRQLVRDLALLASSPLKRAHETATIVARAYGGLEVVLVPELAPGTPLERAMAWLAGLAAQGTSAIVGHEPDLSRLVSALLSGADRPFLAFRKGGACLIEFSGRVERGAGVLDWLLGPKHLRRLDPSRD